VQKLRAQLQGDVPIATANFQLTSFNFEHYVTLPLLDKLVNEYTMADLEGFENTLETLGNPLKFSGGCTEIKIS